MTTLVLGFPGTGISTFHQQVGDDTVTRLVEEEDGGVLAGAIAAVFGSCTYGLIPYTPERLAAIVSDPTFPVTVVYPAPECIKEYLQRYRDQGLSELEVEAMASTIEGNLLALRELTARHIKHVVLGRDEFISDKFKLKTDDINTAMQP